MTGTQGCKTNSSHASSEAAGHGEISLKRPRRLRRGPTWSADVCIDVSKKRVHPRPGVIIFAKKTPPLPGEINPRASFRPKNYLPVVALKRVYGLRFAGGSNTAVVP